MLKWLLTLACVLAALCAGPAQATGNMDNDTDFYDVSHNDPIHWRYDDFDERAYFAIYVSPTAVHWKKRPGDGAMPPTPYTYEVGMDTKGNAPAGIKVVRVDDNVVEVSFTPTGGWVRMNLPMSSADGKMGWGHILPSSATRNGKHNGYCFQCPLRAAPVPAPQQR